MCGVRHLLLGEDKRQLTLREESGGRGYTRRAEAASLKEEFSHFQDLVPCQRRNLVCRLLDSSRGMAVVSGPPVSLPRLQGTQREVGIVTLICKPKALK